jgi:hypothetical protein
MRLAGQLTASEVKNWIKQMTLNEFAKMFDCSVADILQRLRHLVLICEPGMASLRT